MLFGFQTSTEYEYEYYSGLENQANMNTNIFGFEKSSEYEYEYYSIWKYLIDRLSCKQICKLVLISHACLVFNGIASYSMVLHAIVCYLMVL